MATFRVAVRSLNGCLSHQFHQTHFARSLSMWSNIGNGPNDQQTNNSLEPTDDFEQRIFGNISSSNSKTDTLFQKLDRLGWGRDKSSSRTEMLSDLGEGEGEGDGFNTLTDGMDATLENAAAYFEFDIEEVDEDGYSFRYDANYRHAQTYDIKNVRFLANFITPAGIIIKRSQTGIIAKAQRKIAREIKTARAFGLIPFTPMGTKAFVFGKTMEDLDDDYVSRSYDTYMGLHLEDH